MQSSWFFNLYSDIQSRSVISRTGITLLYRSNKFSLSKAKPMQRRKSMSWTAAP
jgi:hypothetical protein